MFLGTHHPRLDEKGRLILPARFRDQLAEGLVVTKGQEHCLFVFPIPEFERVTDALAQAPGTQRSVRDYTRVFFASASQEVPDKQGRITIPPALRDYAELGKDCVVIGANAHVEVWDTGRWSNYVTDREPAFADLETEVLPGVL